MKIRSIIVLSIVLLFFISLNQTDAYTNSGGIETGDYVDLDYVLSYDGEEQQRGPGFKTEVTNSDDGGKLIPGFYEGLLGMKVGQEKQIIVTPEKGYPPDDDLGGKTLYFDVFINTILENVRTDDGSGSDGGAGTVLQTIGTFILAGAGLYIFYVGYSSFQKVTTPKCELCASNGERVRSDGYCKSCGSSYCRDSFLNGCPNCKGNTLLPHKSSA